MYPMFRSKVIYLVRHGQGVHNVSGETDHANYKSWDHMDAPLTDLGRQQAEALHDHVEATGIKAQVELVVVSPLLRTLQTATRVWGEAALPEGESPLLVSRSGKFQHAPIAPSRSLKFVANEWCRERTGVNPCDRRSNISIYRKDFPGVDFSEVQTDEDTWWHDTKRETNEEVFDRARVLVRWLLDRPESQIALVSHSSFLLRMCQLLGAGCSDVVRTEIQTGFQTCEMRAMVIVDRLASGPPTTASLDFRGGLNHDVLLRRDMDIPHRKIVAEDTFVLQADSFPTVA